MTSELVRVVRCDVCGREKATEHTLTLDGQQVEIDLCLEDSGPLEALQSLLDTHGRRARKPRAGSGNPSQGRTLLEHLNDGAETDWQRLGRTCPRCQHLATNRPAVSQHVKAQHGEALTVAERETERRFACGHCTEVHATFLGMTQHQRAHMSTEPPA